jgi:hypothetical protein
VTVSQLLALPDAVWAPYVLLDYCRRHDLALA